MVRLPWYNWKGESKVESQWGRWREFVSVDGGGQRSHTITGFPPQSMISQLRLNSRAFMEYLCDSDTELYEIRVP